MTDPQLDLKRAAAHAAVEHVSSGMILGLGTGSTAALAIEEIGRRIAAGALRDVAGVPTTCRHTPAEATTCGSRACSANNADHRANDVPPAGSATG